MRVTGTARVRTTAIGESVIGPSPFERRARVAATAALATIVVLIVLRPSTAGAIGAQVQSTTETAMTWWKAAILGIVEGVTEYLPISSTGHLLVASELLGLGTTDADIEAANTYAIAIQFGAILAVAGLFWQRFRDMLLGLVGRSDAGRHLLIVLIVAFAPAAVLGFLFDDMIEEALVLTVADRRRLVHRRARDPRARTCRAHPTLG